MQAGPIGAMPVPSSMLHCISEVQGCHTDIARRTCPLGHRGSGAAAARGYGQGRRRRCGPMRNARDQGRSRHQQAQVVHRRRRELDLLAGPAHARAGAGRARRRAPVELPPAMGEAAACPGNSHASAGVYRLSPAPAEEVPAHPQPPPAGGKERADGNRLNATSTPRPYKGRP